MKLQENILSLPKDVQFKVAIGLTKLALPIWNKYAESDPLTYYDTVVGLKHFVHKRILEQTIDKVESYLISNTDTINGKSVIIGIRRQFEDPIVALQDCDWELPNEVQKTFYAVYNLLDAYLGKEKTAFDDSTIYVSINQALDALETSNLLTFNEMNKILDALKNGR